MMMGAPYALWAMLGLIIPVLIHLLSKRKKRQVFFGTLAFLEEKESSAAKSIRISDIRLLVLRMLIIVGAALWLTQLMQGINREKWVFIEDGLEQKEAFTEVLSNIPEDNIRPFSINKGYGLMDFPDYNSFIHYLNDKHPSSEIFTYSYLKNFKGISTKISPDIEWNMLSDPNPRETSLHFYDGDNKYSGQISSDELSYQFTQSIKHSGNPQSPKSLKVKIESSEKRNSEKLQLTTFLSQLPMVVPLEIELTKQNPDWTICIDTSLNMEVSSNLIDWKVKNHAIQTQINNGVVTISGTWSTKEILQSSFPVLLTHILMESAYSYSDLDLRTFHPKVHTEVLKTDPSRKLVKAQWPLFILIVLLLCERIFVILKN